PTPRRRARCSRSAASSVSNSRDRASASTPSVRARSRRRCCRGSGARIRRPRGAGSFTYLPVALHDPERSWTRRSSSLATSRPLSTARRSSWTAASPLPTSLRNSLPLAGLVALAAAALAFLSSRVRDWVVMTDELQYAKLATHIGQTLSPVPTLRGQHVSIYSMLYPALISPFYGLLSAPHAFPAPPVANGFPSASASIPPHRLA